MHSLWKSNNIIGVILLTVYINSNLIFFFNRNDIITSTWLEDPDDRPTFAGIVQKLNSICNFTETIAVTDDIEDTAQSNGYIDSQNDST